MRERQSPGSEDRIRWIRPEEMNRRDRKMPQAPVLALVPIRWEPPSPPSIA